MDPNTFSYKRKLVEINKQIRPGEIKTMKFLLDSIIPKRRMEEITSALELFGALEEREMLGANNLGTLRKLLLDAGEGRVDLVRILDSTNTSNGSSGPLPSLISPVPSTCHDLSEEFQYLSSSVGKNWRVLCRQLTGINEADFEAAIEHNQRNLREQILFTLRLWQTRNPATASRESLANACKRADMKMHAENILDRIYT